MRSYHIPQHVIEAAEEHERIMLATHIGQLDDHTGLTGPHKHTPGYVGEWGFEQFLLEFRIPFFKVLNVWAGHDFVIYMSKYDVKTASKAHYLRLMVPQKQFSPDKDFYVGCRIMDYKFIEVHGTVTSAELGAIKPRCFGDKKVPTHAKFLHNLETIEEHFKNESFI